MKVSKVLVGIVLLGAITTSSCKRKGCIDSEATNFSEKAKKDDGSCTYKPTIVLVGSATVNVPVGTTYTDEGATATNKDGSSVTVTTTGLPINTSTTGTFTVTYTATNDYGTVSISRTVNVVIDQSVYIGTYASTSDCGATALPLSASPEITVGATANEIIIAPALTLVGQQIVANVNGANVTVPFQVIPITVGDIELSGTGTMNASGTEMTITYTYNNTTPLIGSSGTCVAVYTKQ
jgi:hypothetical protein